MTKQSIYPSSGLPRVILLFISLGFAFMMSSGVYYRVSEPGLVVEPQKREQARPMPQESESNPFGILMQRLDNNPNDFDALLQVTMLFIDHEDWENAEVFGVQAVTAKPADMQANYALGLALNGLGRHAEAAESIEKAVALQDSPEIRYSLGVLYAYYLHEPAKARAQFTKGLENPATAKGLREAMQAELDKLPK